MPYILLRDNLPLRKEDENMQKLYDKLWGKKEETPNIILHRSYQVPRLPSMNSDAQIVLNTQVGAIQGDEEPNLASIDPDVEMGTEPTLYTCIQLPDGLTLPKAAYEPPRRTLLVRSCYEEILAAIPPDEPRAAVLGGPGIGKHIRIPIPPAFFRLNRDTGKSCLLLCLLVKSLLAAEPVSYQSRLGFVYCFTALGAYVHLGDDPLDEEKDILHLIDLNDSIERVQVTRSNS
jgi:hypothetical protein